MRCLACIRYRVGDPTNSFILGQDVMRLQHVVQHERQAGHKDAMFKMPSRANLAQQLTLSVSNQISIEQEAILALIGSAYWLALMEFNNVKVWEPAKLGSTTGLVYAQKLLLSCYKYGYVKMWVALKRDQQPAAAAPRRQQHRLQRIRHRHQAAPAPGELAVYPAAAPAPRPPSVASGATVAAGRRHGATGSPSDSLPLVPTQVQDIDKYYIM
jgi:hypothetical protein